jgi:hypothetical protein
MAKPTEKHEPTGRGTAPVQAQEAAIRAYLQIAKEYWANIDIESVDLKQPLADWEKFRGNLAAAQLTAQGPAIRGSTTDSTEASGYKFDPTIFSWMMCFPCHCWRSGKYQ